MGWHSCKSKQYIELLRIFSRINNLSDDRIIRRVHQWSMSLRISLDSKVLKLVDKYGLNGIVHANISNALKMSRFKAVVSEIENNNFNEELWNDKGNQVNGN